MYLQTGFGQLAQPQPKSPQPQPKRRLRWTGVGLEFDVPFRVDFTTFRRELNRALQREVLTVSDKREIERLILRDTQEEKKLRDMHTRLMTRVASLSLKEGDDVTFQVQLFFKRRNLTSLYSMFLVLL